LWRAGEGEAEQPMAVPALGDHWAVRLPGQEHTEGPRPGPQAGQ
jgi:hypothetical protein